MRAARYAPYPPRVSVEEAIARARALVEAERVALEDARKTLVERDRAVRALYELAPDMGPTAIASAVGLTASTVRAITRDLAQARRES